MIVERLWPNSHLRNYHYLVVCEETGEALAIDPLDSTLILDSAREHGWEITQILNTHHHLDHTAGNEALRAATGAQICAHAAAAPLIGGIDVGLEDGDVIRVGHSVELQCLDTPGHTLSHVCLFAHADEPALFSGDTLFNAGAGNCHNGGDPGLMYQTFADQFDKLPESTRIYPGHDYIENNLKFTLNREPGNAAAKALLPRVTGHDPATSVVTTLAEERGFNTFFRLQNAEVVAELRKSFADLPAQPDAKTVFTKLRELRNAW